MSRRKDVPIDSYRDVCKRKNLPRSIGNILGKWRTKHGAFENNLQISNPVTTAGNIFKQAHRRFIAGNRDSMPSPIKRT